MNTETSGRWFRKFWWLLGIAVGCLIWVYSAGVSRINRAEKAFKDGDLESAYALAMEELESNPESDRARVIAGLVYVAARDYAAAREMLTPVTDSNPQLSGIANRELARIAQAFGEASAARTFLLKSLQANSQDTQTVDQRIFLASLLGETREARQLSFRQIQSGVISPNYLTILGSSRVSLESSVAFAKQCLAKNPHDALPRLALAQKSWSDDQLDDVRDQLTPLIQQYPDLFEARSLWCQLLTATSQSREFVTANSELGKAAEQESSIWLARGQWADQQGQSLAAIRCLAEAVRLDPNDRTSHYRLSQFLAVEGKSEIARQFAERAQLLGALSLAIQGLSRSPAVDDYRKIVESLERLGRTCEVLAWCQWIEQQSGSLPEWAAAARGRCAAISNPCGDMTQPSGQLFRLLDPSQYPLPDFRLPHSADTDTSPQISDSKIQFEEQAEPLGIRFTYFPGQVAGDSESMAQMDGGGVAALDYDCDSLPDLFLTQGGNWPTDAFMDQYRDSMFRNRGSGKGFSDITQFIGISESDYGQGVTAGDFDNDGFQDLYVGNIGTNRLYHNNGDGTFSVVSMPTSASARWTSSCLMADLDQDGASDVYAVTYLNGESLSHICSKRSNPRCNPLQFAAEPDSVYFNEGNGTFREATGEYGLEASEGRGLGIVAADFDQSGRLSLFVANDMTANFYFRNETRVPGQPAFQESAILAGLAYDQDGQAKACMGVAAGDANRDGRIDLFVTNFIRQSNDLYLQSEDGVFRDQSREAGLYHASFPLLGWGTQFLDADLDGEPDLIVTNGHVYDPLDPSIPYAMPPQFFRNRGHAHFVELSANQLGAFFQKPHHGRSLTRLDWNRDGLEDVCISHNNQPAALLTNRTERPGHWIGFRLIAIQSARDAIGTTLHLQAGEQRSTMQLTAGDGFQASNERRIVFGLGTSDQVHSLEVIWPSGNRQKVEGVSIDREWILVEQREPLAVP